MKRFLLILLSLLCLAFSSHADGPPPFDARYAAMDVQELAACLEAAMAADLPDAAVCLHEDGTPAIALEDYAAFCAALRRDGLMTLCCFVPDGKGIKLAWHNDLLLSYYQDIALTTSGASWSGGVIPHMSMFGDRLTLVFPLGTGLRLSVMAEDNYDDWRVTEIAMQTSADGLSWRTMAVIPEDCLAEDILLESCIPNDWRYREE